MRRFTLVGCCVFLAFVGLAQAQTNQPQEPNNAAVPEGLYYQPYLAHGQDAQGAGSGKGWFDLRSQPNSPYLLNLDLSDQGSGLTLAPVDDAARAHLKLPKGQGLIVTGVRPQGPAAHAGIQQNDILLTLGDAPLAKPEDLEEHLKAAGEKPLGLVLLHHGQRKTLKVQPRIKVLFGPVQPGPPAFWIGVTVAPVEPALRAHLKLPSDQGLIATEVIADGPAAKAGLKVYDILVLMDAKPLRDQAGLVDLVQKTGERSVPVEIMREGSHQTIQVTPERRKDAHFTLNRLRLERDLNVLHPGVVLEGNAVRTFPFGEAVFLDYGPNSDGPKPQVDPLASRLDSMAGEIKELRKAIEELGKAIKAQK
jgi:membrane-associated protease RseP (regulator of RpoE activity)